MMRALVLGLFCSVLLGQPVGVEAGRLRSHIQFLASDLLEGRAVGTRGGELAEAYMAAALAAAGAQPGAADGTYFQEVPLVGVAVDGASTLELGSLRLSWKKDFVATSPSQEERVSLKAPAVFVGHGIVAPEYGWNDYAGVDVKGKVVVLFTGEPPSEDPAFFQGKALTYYGRWTYKFEEAARQGAVGALLIHTEQTAMYGWSVVENSLGREGVQLRPEPGVAVLRVAGWITTGAAEAAGMPVGDWVRSAGQRGFRAREAGVAVGVNLMAKVRQIRARNVVAKVPGTGPAEEHVVYSAHWDHLGVGGTGPDRIFNGAVDNGTGCATLIELARVWAQVEPRPKATAVFVAVTGEESGLLGSFYYARNPVLPLKGLRVNLNVDGIVPGGRPKGLLALGEERGREARRFVEEAAGLYGLTLMPDPRPEAGAMYRSDHFNFLRAGATAYSLIPVSVPGDFAADYGAKHYHQPSDEYSPEWDMTAIEVVANIALRAGLSAASRP